MNEDALLKRFRAAAGIPAPGEDLGGWYNAAAAFNPPADMHGFIPGRSFGQYVSSLARAFAVTGDVKTRAKVQRLVAGFAPANTPRFYSGYPLPAYAFDKINIGLIDAHAFAQDRHALDLLLASVLHDKSSGRVTVFALNRSSSEEMQLSVELRGLGDRRLAEALELHHPDLKAVNTSGAPSTVEPRVHAQVSVTGARLEAKLCPLCWSVFVTEHASSGGGDPR